MQVCLPGKYDISPECVWSWWYLSSLPKALGWIIHTFHCSRYDRLSSKLIGLCFLGCNWYKFHWGEFGSLQLMTTLWGHCTFNKYVVWLWGMSLAPIIDTSFFWCKYLYEICRLKTDHVKTSKRIKRSTKFSRQFSQEIVSHWLAPKLFLEIHRNLFFIGLHAFIQAPCTWVDSCSLLSWRSLDLKWGEWLCTGTCTYIIWRGYCTITLQSTDSVHMCFYEFLPFSK